jgi:hypothetical protein
MQKTSQGARFNRRQWGAALAGGVLLPLSAPAQAPASPRPPTELDARRDSLRQYQNAIRRARLPRETEPAFRFQP